MTSDSPDQGNLERTEWLAREYEPGIARGHVASGHNLSVKYRDSTGRSSE